MRAFLALALALAACSGGGVVVPDARGGDDGPTVVLDAPTSGDAATVVLDAPRSGDAATVVLDAPRSGDARTGAVGAICAGAPDGAVAVACAPGLACCYPCGIPGCASRCAMPCDGGACHGGCPIIP